MALGYPALAVNDLTLALSSFRRSIEIVDKQEINCTYLALVGLAEIARRQANPALAAFLYGVTERFTQRLKPIEDRWKEAYCRPTRATAQTDLGDSACATAWAEGQVMPFDQAMQVAQSFVYPL